MTRGPTTGGTASTGSRAATVAAGGSRTTSPSAWREDAYTRALRTGTGPLYLRFQDGRLLPLAVERWLADADAADESVLLRCRGTVLDIGCGPGRLVAALAGRGHRALGIDISPTAVARTVLRGGSALCRSVFHPLPGEGRWNTALLLDGNVGIGGDPGALLARTAEVLAPGGRLIVEAAPAEVDECCEVRLDGGLGDLGAPFRWARVGPAALRRHAGRAGWVPARTWTAAGRHFAELRPVRRSRPDAP
ncbi:class I SAM-dependent methyltransferase [Streptomyces sp. NBC_01198]|uniref:class I SAM-dependent methyltransferase n=1 Tax=Streptomyces sp. NBC_01198 TaxID=2903769 RepID=UPI002E124C62|nr:class I SAM-dependent methyltransferase [Streptomyces sp. NBC_01198]